MHDFINMKLWKRENYYMGKERAQNDCLAGVETNKKNNWRVA